MFPQVNIRGETGWFKNGDWLRADLSETFAMRFDRDVPVPVFEPVPAFVSSTNFTT